MPEHEFTLSHAGLPDKRFKVLSVWRDVGDRKPVIAKPDLVIRSMSLHQMFTHPHQLRGLTFSLVLLNDDIQLAEIEADSTVARILRDTLRSSNGAILSASNLQ